MPIFTTNTSNQYRLFYHFFADFSNVFGCSIPFAAPSSTGSTGGSQQLTLAYVHKYMDLNYTDIGHFIDQFGQAIHHFGFSEQGANTFMTDFNADYNVRCAPPVTSDGSTQLLSLCQDPSCSPTAPSPDCAAYDNLQPDSLNASAVFTVTACPLRDPLPQPRHYQQRRPAPAH